jgi:hypothetical protein
MADAGTLNPVSRHAERPEDPLGEKLVHPLLARLVQ